MKKIIKKSSKRVSSPSPKETTLELFNKMAKPKGYSLAQFKMGLKVEGEHKDITKGDPVKTAKIVLAHLKELPDYYTKLKKVERVRVPKK